MGKGGGNTTTTTNSDPWTEQKPYLTHGFQEADRIYRNTNPEYFRGNTVADPSAATYDSWGRITDRAVSGNVAENTGEQNLAQTLSGQFQGAQPGNWTLNQIANSSDNRGVDLLNSTATGAYLNSNPGMNLYNQVGTSFAPGTELGSAFLSGTSAERNALSNFGQSDPQSQAAQMLMGRRSPTTGFGFAAQAGLTPEQQALSGFGMGNNANFGMDALTQTASGAYLNSNPYLDRQFDQAASRVTDRFQQAVAPGTDLSAVAAGRFGSGTHQRLQQQNEQQLSDQLNDLATNIYGGNYQAERARQDQAAGQLGQLQQGEYGQQLAALGQALDSRMAGANLLENAFGQQSQNIAQAGGLTQNEQAQRLQALGQTLDDRFKNQALGAQLQTDAFSQNMANRLAAGQAQDTAYQNERALQTTAAQNIGSLLQGEDQQRLAAALGMNESFQDERSNQMDAAKTALGYGQQDWTDLSQLASVGAQQDALNQARIYAEIDKWNFNQNKQWNELANYMNMIQGSYGGTSTATGPGNRSNPLMGGLGGAASGAMMGSMIMPGVGTAIGGGLGLLAGLFG